MARRRGKRLTRTGSWTLTPKKGRKRDFTGTLKKILNIGKVADRNFYGPQNVLDSIW